MVTFERFRSNCKTTRESVIENWPPVSTIFVEFTETLSRVLFWMAACSNFLSVSITITPSLSSAPVSFPGHEGDQRGLPTSCSDGLPVGDLPAHAAVLAERPLQTSSLLRHRQHFGQTAPKPRVSKSHS